MRKNRVIALVVASVVSTAAVAGAQAPAQGTARAERHGEMGRGFEGRGGRGLLRGLTLSDAEKTKLKEIRTKYAAERKPLVDAMRPAMEQARAARQKGDTAAARAAFERTKADRDKAKALRDRELAEMRAALTPDNQKKLDENLQQIAKRRDEWKKQGKDGKRGHGMHEWRGRPGQNG